MTPLGKGAGVGTKATEPGPTIGVNAATYYCNWALKIVAGGAVEGGDLGSLEDVGAGVALGGREEEVDFQVAQEGDAERGPRARDRVGGSDQTGLGYW